MDDRLRLVSAELDEEAFQVRSTRSSSWAEWRRLNAKLHDDVVADPASCARCSTPTG